MTLVSATTHLPVAHRSMLVTTVEIVVPFHRLTSDITMTTSVAPQTIHRHIASCPSMNGQGAVISQIPTSPSMSSTRLARPTSFPPWALRVAMRC